MYKLIENNLFQIDANLPLTPPEVKKHINFQNEVIDINDTSKDADIIRMIRSCMIYFTSYTGIPILDETWALFLDDLFYTKTILFQKRKTKAILLFEYYPYNWDGVAPRSVLNPLGDYYTIEETDFNYLEIILLNKPSLYCRKQNIRITATVGLISNPTQIPANLKQALLQHVARLYFQEGTDCDNCETAITPGIKSIYNQYKSFYL
jgi:uncharacterized phiE125 gp8 family phage protein